MDRSYTCSLTYAIWKQVFSTARKWTMKLQSLDYNLSICFRWRISPSSCTYSSPPFIIQVMPGVHVLPLMLMCQCWAEDQTALCVTLLLSCEPMCHCLLLLSEERFWNGEWRTLNWGYLYEEYGKVNTALFADTNYRPALTYPGSSRSDPSGVCRTASENFIWKHAVVRLNGRVSFAFTPHPPCRCCGNRWWRSKSWTSLWTGCM